jgi:hypothetical protein
MGEVDGTLTGEWILHDILHFTQDVCKYVPKKEELCRDSRSLPRFPLQACQDAFRNIRIAGFPIVLCDCSEIFHIRNHHLKMKARNIFR